jgi:hypothetical protein
VDWFGETNILEKHAVSIFMAEVDLKMERACFPKMLAYTNQATQQFNPKEHHQNCHCHENLKSHKCP